MQREKLYNPQNESTSIPHIQNEKASRTDLSTLPIDALPIRYDNGDVTRNELLEGLSFVVAKISDKKNGRYYPP
ncbi:unnamed protein product [Rotaria sp. Silwood1]|nr:unnamed protein product [Rotaria sp. Silwood1]CAF0958277.1 unnamed protein product [Rotaria sp. Silwood1]CAF3379528.1 unnamed protein product [Rotaria sp. Silwood1]CAF4573964.1 unnamed protein product [Rotaria sp. Silwood1]